MGATGWTVGGVLRTVGVVLAVVALWVVGLWVRDWLRLR